MINIFENIVYVVLQNEASTLKYFKQMVFPTIKSNWINAVDNFVDGIMHNSNLILVVTLFNLFHTNSRYILLHLKSPKLLKYQHEDICLDDRGGPIIGKFGFN